MGGRAVNQRPCAREVRIVRGTQGKTPRLGRHRVPAEGWGLVRRSLRQPGLERGEGLRRQERQGELARFQVRELRQQELERQQAVQRREGGFEQRDVERLVLIRFDVV